MTEEEREELKELIREVAREVFIELLSEVRIDAAGVGYDDNGPNTECWRLEMKPKTYAFKWNRD